MNSLKLTTIIISSMILFFGCDESKAWRQTVNESIGQITETIEEFTVAIPGERYLRLLEKSRTGTPAEKEQARQDIIALFGVDPAQKEYKVTVSFKFERELPIQAALVMNLTGEKIDLARAVQEHRINPKKVGSDIMPPLTNDQLRESIKQSIASGLNLMAGSPEWAPLDPTNITGNNINEFTVWPNSPLMPTFKTSGNIQDRTWRTERDSKIRALTTRRSDVAEAFTQGIWKLRAPLKSRTTGSPNISYDWSPMDGPNAFVLIKQEDFEYIKNEYAAKSELNEPIAFLSLHKDGNPAETVKNLGQIELTISNFLPENNIEIPGMGKFVWTVRNLTGSRYINNQTVVSLDQLRENLARLQKLNK